MSQDQELQQLHEVLLLIADEIDRICRENSINYTIYAGTMIGAMRHKGFIPWDDDFDVAMLREDYNRFIKVCESGLKREFRLITPETVDTYSYGFAKIALIGTSMVQGGYSKPHEGVEINVDIFPFDKVPSSSLLQFFHRTKNYCYIKLLQEHYDGYYVKNASIFKRIGFGLLSIINRFTDKRKLVFSLEKNAMKYQNTNAHYVTSMGSSYGYRKEIQNITVFEDYKDVEFEGHLYKIISNPDSLLASVYGDYMQLPPVEERHAHEYDSIYFGKCFHKD